MKVILLTNILSPYRSVLFQKLNSQFSRVGYKFLVVVMAKTEFNRTWKYDDFKKEYTKLLPAKSFKIFNKPIHFNWGFKKLLKEFKPDLVISSGSYIFPSVWASIAHKNRFGYKLIFWSESHLDEVRDYPKFILNLRNRLRHLIYRRFDGFIYAGEKSRQFIETYHKDTPLFFLPNIIDEKNYYKANLLRSSQKVSLKEKYQIDPNMKIFFCVARLTKVKGIVQFLEIFAKNRYKNKCQLIIAGDGELKEMISEIAIQNKINISLLGNRSVNDIIELYATADYFFLPSLSDSNPLSCIEAIWAGLPLLVSEHVGNFPEVVSEGVNGYVFNYSSINQAVSIVENLTNIDDKWLENAHNESLRLAKTNYDSDKAVNSLVMTIKDYLGS